MVLSITNIADYLTTAKIIIGASANITTKKKTELTKQIDQFRVVSGFTVTDTNSIESFSVDYNKILIDLASSITIDSDDNGIIYFTESSSDYYNIMQLFNTTYDSYHNDITNDAYIDYYYRFTLLNEIISSENNVIPVKSYTAGSIKNFYNFIKDLNTNIEKTDFVNIVKIFKYYYQMVVIISNHAYLNHILSSFNNYKAIKNSEFTTGSTNILKKIQDKIKKLVIDYVQESTPTQDEKTTIINLINLGNLGHSTYSYKFVLDPKDSVGNFEEYSKYYIIEDSINNIIICLNNIKTYFTVSGTSATTVDAQSSINSMVTPSTLNNFKGELELIYNTIYGIITIEPILSYYITFIDNLNKFFVSIDSLITIGSTLANKQTAITDIKNLIPMRPVSLPAENTFLKENEIVQTINSINTNNLDNGSNIVNNGESEITIYISENAESSYAASITTLDTFFIDDSRDDILGSDRHFYITDTITNFIINVEPSTTDTLKYYKHPTGFDAKTQITTGTSVPIGTDDTDIRIEVVIFTAATPANGASPAVAETENQILTITLRRITNNDMLDKHIDLFKSSNSGALDTIFTNLFNSYVDYDVSQTNNFGVELVTKLNELKLQFDFTEQPSGMHEHIILIKMSEIGSSSAESRTNFKNLADLESPALSITTEPNLKLTIPATSNYLDTYNTRVSNLAIDPTYLTNIKLAFSGDSTIQNWFDTFFKYHEKKQAVKNHIDAAVETAAGNITSYISSSTDFSGTTVETSKNFKSLKEAIKNKSKSYKENVDKYKTKDNELNNILKNNLYNNIFLYITIVVLILICLGLIYINNHKASLKTQYSVMLIAFLLLYYIIYTNVTVNITETFYSGSFDDTSYIDAITTLHSSINTFLNLNMYNVDILEDIGKSFKKEKNKYDGFVKSSNSKLNSLELVLNDEFINAIKSKELVKFLILFTAICIISYIVYTNTEDPTTTSIIFIILFVIILAIYFYNINLMTRTKADTKYWNHRMIMK